MSHKEQIRVQELENEIEQLLDESQPVTGTQLIKNMNQHFIDFFKNVQHNVEEIFHPLGEGIKNSDDEVIVKELEYFINCDSCYTISEYFRDGLQDTINQQIILTLMQTQLCTINYDNMFCYELVQSVTEYLDALMETIFSLVLHKEFLCHYVFPVCDETKFVEMKISDYEDEILKDKPDHIQNDDFIDNLYQIIEENEDEPETYNIVQISDWHVDYRYQEGTIRNCKMEICCQVDYGWAEKQIDRARKYGELTCDLPYITAEKQMEALSQIKEKIDLIIWTGDSISHDVHHTNYQETLDTIGNLSTLMKSYFPNTPIIPALGNHDFYPVNYYNPNVPNQPSLRSIGDYWRLFISDEEVEQFRKYGFYKIDMPPSVQKKSPKPATILVLNSQVCYNVNWGISNETNDGSGQLQWLQQQLKEAEQENRVVMIAAHIAPGCYTCIAKWGGRYTALFERYQHIIRFGVYGHDHRELYEIIRGTKSNKPIGLNNVAGSLGTYLQVQPSVRLYTMHAKHHIPLEFKVLEFNLEDANNGIFEFKETVAMKEDFKMQNLGPTAHSKLSESFLNNDKVAQQFHAMLWKHGPQSKVQCDAECKKALYCDTYYSVNDKKVICNENDFEYIKIIDFVLGSLMNPWVQKITK